MASVYVGGDCIDYSIVSGEMKYVRIDGIEYSPGDVDTKKKVAAWLTDMGLAKEELPHAFTIKLMEEGYLSGGRFEVAEHPKTP